MRSNYALRERALALRAAAPSGPTAVVTHGANPGLVSHFVKLALLNLASGVGLAVPKPKARADWAALAERLGVKVIHIAERDTQVGGAPKRPGEFVNTWSIDGFVGEGMQPAELGWGTHERHFPADGARHEFGGGAAIYLERPGAAHARPKLDAARRALSRLPHHPRRSDLDRRLPDRRRGRSRALSADRALRLSPVRRRGAVAARARRQELALQGEKRLLMDEIDTGIDELGVLLMGHALGAYWFGSRLAIGEARRLVPYNNATSLQVTASVLAGMVWAIENPDRSIVEPDEIDHERIIEIARPYLGDLVGAYSGWTPLDGRARLFPEDLDRADPWQFKNFRVT